MLRTACSFFFEACHAGDWDKASNLREQISQLEKDADVLKREIRLKLPRGLFMPVDRTDMLGLLTQQDKLANLSKDIAGRVLGRQLQIPTTMYRISLPMFNVALMQPVRPAVLSTSWMSCWKQASRAEK